jgi:hypothetical protein
MGIVRRVVRIVVGVIGFVLYTWYEAVRLAPAVKRRKAMRRRQGADRRHPLIGRCVSVKRTVRGIPAGRNVPTVGST